jgi:hypothetical protein
MYKVIRYFRDAQDDRHAYNVGDTFPREGMIVTQERINDLMNGNNFQQVPLIAYVPDKEAVKAEKPKKDEKPKKESKKEPVKESEDISKDEISKMPFFKLKSVAKEYGIDVKDKKAEEIRAELMEKL